MDRASLLNNIKTFQPVGVPEANLVLAGAVGSGKSSYVNSIQSALKGRITGAAEFHDDPNSVTKKFRKYPIGCRNKWYPITLCDTMGMEELGGMELTDILYVLDGRVPDGFTFDSRIAVHGAAAGLLEGYPYHRMMHGVGVVVKGPSVALLPTERIQKIKSLQAFSASRGLRLVILLSGVDLLSEAVRRDSAAVYQDRRVLDTMTKLSSKTGVPRKDILPVRNYSDAINTDEATDVMNLRAFWEMLYSAGETIKRHTQGRSQ